MTRYFKLIRRNKTHHGFTYKEGLNVLNEPFNDKPSCGPGGLYFSEEHDVLFWRSLYDDIAWVTEVTIPSDARVIRVERSLKADRIICGPFMSLADYINAGNTLTAVQQDGWLLQFVREQTPALCMAAVRESGSAIQFVKEQTPAICMAAVQKNGWAILHVREQTPALCMAAVKQHGWAIINVKEQTPELCMSAVQQDGVAIRFVKEQTPALCLLAVLQNGLALQYVEEQTDAICIAAIKQCGHAALKYVKRMTPAIQCAADWGQIL